MAPPVTPQHISAPLKPRREGAKSTDGTRKTAVQAASDSFPTHHSSVPTPQGMKNPFGGRQCMAESIVREWSEYETIPGFGEKRDYTKLSKEEIVQIVRMPGL